MTAMELLARCRRAAGDLASLRGREERLREVTMSPGGHGGDGAGVRGTSERDRMAAYAATLDGLTRARALRERRARMEEMASAVLIDRALRGHDAHAEVAHAYYVRRKDYKEIASDMCLSVSRVRNLRLEAAAMLRDVPEEAVGMLLPPEYREVSE